MTKSVTEHGMFSSVQQRINYKDFQNCLFACFLSQAEPKKVIQALIDLRWIEAMQDKLLQFKLQQVWTLVDLPYGKRAIGTKWIYRNKKDERGIVVRNKARLVAQGYTQEDGIDYDEVFAPVARIEAIRLFLAYASFKHFVVYKMDVKSAFRYGKIEEEVYVYQPPGFEDLEFPDRVYKVEKALYGLHQAPRAWYETLSTYLLDNGFQRGQIDKTLFIKRVKIDILLVQVYVDDIIFGSTKKELCTKFEKLMHKKFQMSSMGKLTFFLGLQVTQKDDGIFISQDRYVDEILKKFSFSTVKTASTPMETSKPLLKDENAKDVDVHLYRSMIGSLMYLTSLRPNIMFAVCACARFQVTPKVSHLHVVKRIFRYLKGQPKLGLWYPKDSPFVLEAYTDSDYVGASLDRKSTTGAANDGIQVSVVGLTYYWLKLVTVGVTTAEGQPSEPQHTPTTASPSHVVPIPTVASSSHTKNNHKHRKTKRKATKISQSSRPTTHVADDSVHEERGHSAKRVTTTAASLDAEQDSGNIIRTQSMATLNEPIPQGTNSVNTLGSGGDNMKLNELMEIYTKLFERVLALENIKTAQNLEIINLKKRVKKLEKKKRERTPQLKRGLFKVSIESSAEKSLETQGRYGHDFEVNIVEPITTASAPVTTTGVSVSTAEPSTPPTKIILIEDEDLTIAQTLMKMRSVKSKEKSKEKGVSSETTIRPTRGVIMKEASETVTRPIVPPQQQLDPKDKGKGIMQEPEKPVKVKGKDQIAFDEEVARRLEAQMQAEYEEEERVARQREEEDNLISWDNTQAMMEADYELAQRLQAEEQGELTIEERSKLFVELMDKRKKHFAKLRAEEIKRKPPTKAQKRNQMYLFVPMDLKVVEGSKSHAEGSKKRIREELESDNSKKQKIDENVEADMVDEIEMKKHMEIVPDDKVAIDAIPLATKSPIINIDREDLETLWKLVKAKRGNTRPEEAYERVLWVDLKVMFKPDVEITATGYISTAGEVQRTYSKSLLLLVVKLLLLVLVTTARRVSAVKV
ncbi:putative ribonuclease H-like domain-containing protein [Tanacetum coccineum]